MLDDAYQMGIDGALIPVPARQGGQQLALFVQQGPGGTLPLPAGELVQTARGMQWTLPLAGTLAPAEATWNGIIEDETEGE